MASRARHQPRAVAGRSPSRRWRRRCLAQRSASATLPAPLSAAGDGRRRAVAGGERPCRNGAAAMADPAGGVPARRWPSPIGSARCCRLLALARRPDDGCCRSCNRFSRVAVPVVGVAGADRACAGDRPAGELWRADRNQIRDHPVDQAGAGRRAAGPCGAQSLSPDAGACRSIRRTRGRWSARSCSNASSRSASWPLSPAGASRRRRVRWPRRSRRRSRSISIPTQAMFQVLISPGKAGIDDFVLQLMTGDASPLQAKEATLIAEPARARHRADRAQGRRWARTAIWHRPRRADTASPAAGICASTLWSPTSRRSRWRTSSTCRAR